MMSSQGEQIDTGAPCWSAPSCYRRLDGRLDVRHGSTEEYSMLEPRE